MLALQLDALETQERESFVRLVSDGSHGAAGSSASEDTSAGVNNDSLFGENANAAIHGGNGGQDTISGSQAAEPSSSQLAQTDSEPSVTGVEGWEGKPWSSLAEAQDIDPDAYLTAEPAPEGLTAQLPTVTAQGRYGVARTIDPELFVGPDGNTYLRPEFSEKLDEYERKYHEIAGFLAESGHETAAKFLDNYLDGDGMEIWLDEYQLKRSPSVAEALERTRGHFENWLQGILHPNDPSEELEEVLTGLQDGQTTTVTSGWDGRIFNDSVVANTLDETDAFLALGRSKINGTAEFTFTRRGDEIIFSATVNWKVDETYDFESGISLPIVDPNNILGSIFREGGLMVARMEELIALAKYGRAANFATKAQWSESVVGSMTLAPTERDAKTRELLGIRWGAD